MQICLAPLWKMFDSKEPSSEDVKVGVVNGNEWCWGGANDRDGVGGG